MYRYLIAIISAWVFFSNANAAVLIESEDEDKKKARVLIDGNRARIDSGALGGYMLLNLEKEKVYAINHEERVILDLSSPIVTHSAHKSETAALPKIEIKAQGKGPKIAGYATKKYRVFMNGLHCFDEYLAPSLLKNKEIKRFVQILAKTTQAQENNAIGLPFDEQTPCDSAPELADDYYEKYGIPLRTVDGTGLISHQITSINTKASFLPGTFSSPNGYTAVTRQDMLQRVIDSVPSHASVEEMNMEDIIELQNKIQKQIQQLEKSRKLKNSQQKDNPDKKPSSGS